MACVNQQPGQVWGPGCTFASLRQRCEQISNACTNRGFWVPFCYCPQQPPCPRHVRVPCPQAGRQQLHQLIVEIRGLISAFRSSWKEELERLPADVGYRAVPSAFLSLFSPFPWGTLCLPRDTALGSCSSRPHWGSFLEVCWKLPSRRGLEAMCLSGARQIAPRNPPAVVCSICQGLRWPAPFHQRYR